MNKKAVKKYAKSPVLTNDWRGKDTAQVFYEFYNDKWQFSPPEFIESAMKNTPFMGYTLLYGDYSTASYEGQAFLLLESEGKLYEVNASHCSCFGLEGQFEPEETSIEALRHRMNEGNLGRCTYMPSSFLHELEALLCALEAEEAPRIIPKSKPEDFSPVLHTVLQGNAMVCLHCNDKYEVNMPIPAKLLFALMAAFNDIHAACKEQRINK